ncbi:MAG TPA: hypothetical protein VNX02_12535 [Steroidobacteraceae bacterium]|jgi:hypothetical protein|nr:hypothetical protein [Steroidobacteraceae bacterium]
MAKRVVWARKPAREDFNAAQCYLSLICAPTRARRLVARLRRAEAMHHAAKDLLRASGLPLLPHDEKHVAADLKRIRKGKALSPVLLVQGDMKGGAPLTVADGYHRICASCYIDENALIACRIVAGGDGN